MDLHRGHRPLNHPHIQEGLFRRLPFMNQRQDRRPNSSIKMKYFNFKFYAFFSLLFYLILFSYRYKHNALNYQIYKDNFPKDLDFYESIFYLFNEDAHYFSDEKLHDTDLASFVNTPPQINSHNFMSIFHNILHNLSNIYPNYKEEVLETRHTPHKRKLWEYVADAIVYQYKKRQIWSIHSINRYLSKGQTFGKHTKTMLTKTRNLKSFLKLSLASLQRQQMSSVITFWDKLEARFYMGKLDKILYTFLRMMHTDYWVSLNAAYCCLIIIAKLVYKFTFGSLRSAEQIQVRTKIFDFIFNKMIFMFGLLNIDNLGDFTLWTTWFALTGFLHTTSHLLKSRLDYLVLSPRIPVGTKIKMASLLLALIVWANALTIGVIFSYVKFGMFAAPVYLFLLYECMMLQFNCYHILYNIIINVYDSWHAGCWESKNLYLYYGDLVFGISVLIIDLFYHVHMLLWGSLILSMASLFLFMELKWIFNELRTKVMKHQNYLKILKQIDSKYPMASNEDLQRYNSHCSICWDPMKRARKLPCDHLFHDTCLRSWLEHDLSCPICRRSLGPNATTTSRNQTQSTNLDNTNVNTNINTNNNRFFMPFGFHRRQTNNNNNANINSRNNNNSFMFRTIFYTTTQSPSPSVPSLSTQQQQTPNNANTSNLANMNLRIRFSRNQPNDLNLPQTEQAEQSNIAVPNTPLPQPINSRIATFTYRIGNLLGSNTLNTATRVNPFANNLNEPIIPINGQGINYDAHLNRSIQTPPNDINNNNNVLEENLLETLATDTHIINHDNININNNITNNNNRSFNNFFFYFIDTILGWLNTACQRLIFFLLDSLFNLSASLSNNVTINAIPPITPNTHNNATALENDQTTPDGLDTNLSPTTLNTEIQNGTTMPINTIPVTTTSSPQIRRVNQFFHFDASRYISWLPSISLHVSHLRISQPNTPLTHNATNTASTINNSTSNNITNSNTHQPPPNINEISDLNNTTSSNSLSSVTSYIMDNMVRQVSDIFPNIPLSRIRDDLTVTWSVDRTIENILEGPLSTIIPGYDIEDDLNNANEVAINNININNNQFYNLAGGDSNNTQSLRRRRKRTNAENLVNNPNIVSNLNTTTLINTHKHSLSFLNTINPNINVRNVNYLHNNNSHESTILGDIESSDENSLEESITEDEDGANPTKNGNVFKNYDTTNQITKECPTRATKSVEKDNVQSKNPFSTINVKEGFSHYFGDKIMNKKDDFSNDNQSNSNSSLPNTVSQPMDNADNIASTSKAKLPFTDNENKHPVTKENSPFITYKGRFDSNSEMRETLLTLRKREMLQRARKFLAAHKGDLNH